MHAVLARRTHAVPAVWTAEARLAQAAAVDVVAASAVGALAHAFAVLTVSACSALLIAPEGSGTEGWINTWNHWSRVLL